MSEKRRAAMEKIAAGLPANTLYIDGQPIQAGEGKVLTEDGPVSIAPTPADNLTEAVKETVTPGATPAKAQGDARAYDAYIQRTHAQGLRLEGLQARQQSLVKQQAQRTLQSAQGAVNSIKGNVGGLPIPGGLMAPLLTLLVFYMLLIKVNGNTRFGWLWLVFTGNAEVSSQNTGGGAPLTDASATTDNTGTAMGGGPPVMPYVPAGYFPELDEW